MYSKKISKSLLLDISLLRLIKIYNINRKKNNKKYELLC
jgi:hypothetical protein